MGFYVTYHFLSVFVGNYFDICFYDFLSVYSKVVYQKWTSVYPNFIVFFTFFSFLYQSVPIRRIISTQFRNKLFLYVHIWLLWKLSSCLIIIIIVVSHVFTLFLQDDYPPLGKGDYQWRSYSITIVLILNKVMLSRDKTPACLEPPRRAKICFFLLHYK